MYLKFTCDGLLSVCSHRNCKFLNIDHPNTKRPLSPLSETYFLFNRKKDILVTITSELQVIVFPGCKNNYMVWNSTQLIRSIYWIHFSFFSVAESPPCDLQITTYKLIMVCSCKMPSNPVWLQIIFSFLRSLLCENGRSLRFPRMFIKKTNSVIEW